MRKSVQDASWERLGSEKPLDGRVFVGHVGSQNGTKIDLGATLGRLGRTFLGDFVADRFFIDLLMFFYRFWDGFWNQKSIPEVTQEQTDGNAKLLCPNLRSPSKRKCFDDGKDDDEDGIEKNKDVYAA